ncbi:hypothetical protein ADT71_23820 [Novosphingobium sp. ST904]|nr:hypothetical protein ADT71_23820 [Novosphingobium sp. ST904]
MLGLIVQAGRSGFIPAWGEAEAPAWLQLVVICQALAIAYGYAGSSRGFLIIGLCGLGAYTLARAVLAALVEVVAAVRH